MSKRLNVKKWLIVALLAVLLVGVISFALKKQGTDNKLHFGKHVLNLEFANTQEQHEKGLGGRASLSTNKGMLFVFDKAGLYCFWMKDMKFPLDIVWIDDKKQVVQIDKNLSPDTYPQQYCPEKLISYVLEVNANTTSSWGLNLGDTLSF